MSIDYYEANCEEYYQNTVHVDMSELYEPFLACLPEGGSILDAGCGSGRDSRNFMRMGYQVTAFDASQALAAKARELTGLPVTHMRFEDMTFTDEFDGIWACASMLHVETVEMPDVFHRFVRALYSGGHWYMSFKHGDGELVRDGRLFVDQTEASLTLLVNEFRELELVRAWQSDDVRPDRQDERWLNAIVRKSG